MNIGATPWGESCAQLGSEGYEERARAECLAYMGQIERILKANNYKIPKGFLYISRNEHDFGTYFEVAIKEGVHPTAQAFVDGNLPENWDQEAILALPAPPWPFPSSEEPEPTPKKKTRRVK